MKPWCIAKYRAISAEAQNSFPSVCTSHYAVSLTSLCSTFFRLVNVWQLAEQSVFGRVGVGMARHKVLKDLKEALDFSWSRKKEFTCWHFGQHGFYEKQTSAMERVSSRALLASVITFSLCVWTMVVSSTMGSANSNYISAYFQDMPHSCSLLAKLITGTCVSASELPCRAENGTVQVYRLLLI